MRIHFCLPAKKLKQLLTYLFENNWHGILIKVFDFNIIKQNIVDKLEIKGNWNQVNYRRFCQGVFV